ncbi:hypothetical protein [Thioalkalivibrio sp. HK1]|uniref:hypothetical protein n=1 Tax=Thioalkalivibrio sp. HK1 TaxID=1469245 RepID=UPI00047281CF|nr:hypothetical protein [Thioalkalivibrio sp. HK1]
MEQQMDGSFSQLILFAIVIFFSIWPFWRIWKRTGHSGWPSLLIMIPLVNIAMIYVLAFKAWPIEKEADESTDG